MILLVCGTLLGIAAAFSAMGKLRRMPQVMDTMRAVGVPDERVPALAILELLGVVGLLVGIWIPVLGLLAAIGLALYFLGAIVAHARVGHAVKDLAPAGFLLVLAVITVLGQFAR